MKKEDLILEELKEVKRLLNLLTCCCPSYGISPSCKIHSVFDIDPCINRSQTENR
jgi:hypothetical protein